MPDEIFEGAAKLLNWRKKNISVVRVDDIALNIADTIEATTTIDIVTSDGKYITTKTTPYATNTKTVIETVLTPWLKAKNSEITQIKSIVNEMKAFPKSPEKVDDFNKIVDRYIDAVSKFNTDVGTMFDTMTTLATQKVSAKTTGGSKVKYTGQKVSAVLILDTQLKTLCVNDGVAGMLVADLKTAMNIINQRLTETGHEMKTELKRWNTDVMDQMAGSLERMTTEYTDEIQKTIDAIHEKANMMISEALEKKHGILRSAKDTMTEKAWAKSAKLVEYTKQIEDKIRDVKVEEAMMDNINKEISAIDDENGKYVKGANDALDRINTVVGKMRFYDESDQIIINNFSDRVKTAMDRYVEKKNTAIKNGYDRITDAIKRLRNEEMSIMKQLRDAMKSATAIEIVGVPDVIHDENDENKMRVVAKLKSNRDWTGRIQAVLKAKDENNEEKTYGTDAIEVTLGTQPSEVTFEIVKPGWMKTQTAEMSIRILD